jgi:lysophospholipase L1-like esterase
MMRYSARIVGNVALLTVSIVVALLLVEAILAVWKPIEIRVSGDEINLPAFRRYVIRNDGIRGLEPEIHHSKNNIGFRGPDWSPGLSGERWFFVGGSTTEGFYISDGATWPELVGKALADVSAGLWVNNAGLDGHTTFGHAVLLKQHIRRLEPTAVLFLIGVNDIGAEAPESYDGYLQPQRAGNSLERVGNWLNNNSQIGQLALVIRRSLRAKQLGLTHNAIDLSEPRLLPENLAEDKALEVLQAHRPYVAAYRDRVRGLTETVRGFGARPVLITQPALYGPPSPTAGKDWSRLPMPDRFGILDGMTKWRVQELYNDVLRELAAVEGLLLIDLAAQLPKDEAYFYDQVHFNPQGEKRVAEIVSDAIRRAWFAGDDPATPAGLSR